VGFELGECLQDRARRTRSVVPDPEDPDLRGRIRAVEESVGHPVISRHARQTSVQSPRSRTPASRYSFQTTRSETGSLTTDPRIPAATSEGRSTPSPKCADSARPPVTTEIASAV